MLAWNRDLYEKIGFEECIKRFVVSGTLHYTWDDTVAIIFEFRRVKLRGGKCSLGMRYFTVLNSLVTGVSINRRESLLQAVTKQHEDA